MLIDGGRTSTQVPATQLLAAAAAPPLSAAVPYRSAAPSSYHPQFPRPASTPLPPATGPYALPAGSTLAQTAGGTQAQPFDVTLSQLASTVYGTRGDPPAGWAAVSNADIAQQLRDAGNPKADEATAQTWRETFLTGGEQTTQQEFKADIYRDADGNFVLAYRGTAEGAKDWANNFEQGLGFTTDPVDKFSGTAVNTAVEFKRVFADDGATNLAITGHSQGGGLATVGSLASGIPAVTFDASGIHPETLDRMGLADPQAARDIAEGGQIRAYSLSSDALTNLQEGSPAGLLAPDALGTKIVVQPNAVDRHTLAGRGAGVEFDAPLLGQAGINALVEAARHSPIPLFNVVGDVVYAAFSHSPELLTDAMIDRQPWQPGYENPSSLGKDLQNLVPDVLKDDFADNTHETAADIVDVVNGDLKNGDYVQGGFSIYGDVTAGAWNSLGDTANRGAEALADVVDRNVGGPFGGLLAGTINAGGDVTNVAADVIGGGAEHLADGAGFVAQKTTDLVGWLARG